MKKCPACGYPDRGGAACSVCGMDLSSVALLPEPRPEKDLRMRFMAGLLLLCCFAAFFVTGRFGRRPPAPARGGDVFTDEAAFGYEGVLYSLDRMAGLKYLPAEDKLRVLPLLESRDERVACAAARLAGNWLRSGGVDAELFSAALLKAAREGGPATRRRAAMELSAPGLTRTAAGRKNAVISREQLGIIKK